VDYTVRLIQSLLLNCTMCALYRLLKRCSTGLSTLPNSVEVRRTPPPDTDDDSGIVEALGGGILSACLLTALRLLLNLTNEKGQSVFCYAVYCERIVSCAVLYYSVFLVFLVSINNVRLSRTLNLNSFVKMKD